MKWYLKLLPLFLVMKIVVKKYYLVQLGGGWWISKDVLIYTGIPTLKGTPLIYIDKLE